MIDIVEELRNGIVAEDGLIILDELCLDAADEIERNRAAIAELVGALKHIQTDLVLGKENEAIVSSAITKHDLTTTKEEN